MTPVTTDSAPDASELQSSTVTKAVFALMVLGTTLRLALLTHQSFWYDESFSVRLSKSPLWSIATGRAVDLGNPPLYHLLLHVWMRAFGSGDAIVRAMSVLPAVASIPLVYAVGRRLIGQRVGLLAALIFCLSPVQVYFAQEARPYSLVTFVCLASTWALLRAAQAVERTTWWAAFSALTFVAVYSHYFAGFVVVAQATWLIAEHARNRRVLLRFIAALGAAGLVFALVWLPAFLDQLTTKGNLGRAPDTWYLHVLAIPLVFGVGTTLLWKDLITPLRIAAAGLAIPALVGLAAMGMWTLRRNRSALLLLVAWLSAPVLLPALVSLMLFPLFYVRYALMASPAYYILIAAGLLRLRSGARSTVGVTLLLISALSMWTYFTTLVKHDWRSTAAWVTAGFRNGDVIAFDADFGETAFSHYAGPDDHRLRLLPPPDGDKTHPYWGKSARREPAHSLTPALMGATRVWFVLYDPKSGSGDYYRDLLQREWHRIDGRRFRGIDVGVYQRSP